MNLFIVKQVFIENSKGYFSKKSPSFFIMISQIPVKSAKLIR